MKIQIPVPLFSCDVPLLSECRSEWSWCSTDMIRSGAVVVGGFPPVTRTQHNTNLHYQPHACLYYNKVYKNILQLHKANQKHIAHGHYWLLNIKCLWNIGWIDKIQNRIFVLSIIIIHTIYYTYIFSTFFLQ